MLDDIKKAMAEAGRKLMSDDSVAPWLAEKSFSQNCGARSLRKGRGPDIEGRIATLIAERGDAPIEAVGVTVKDGELETRGM